MKIQTAATQTLWRCAAIKRYDDESGEILVETMALYRKVGFKVIPNYGPYVDMPESVCMKKEL